MGERYRIVNESQSFHCCFSKTVVDTTRPVMIHGKHHDGKYVAMCECIDEEAAPVICDALNAVDHFRWIPVSDRLPDDDVDVLVVEEDGRMLVVRLYHGHWGSSFGSGGPTEGRAWPTHWMPLPEPPEAK